MNARTSIKRIVRSGFVSFWRNGLVSVASLLVFMVTLFIVGGLIFGNAVLNAALTQLKDKVDIVVYFTVDADEQAAQHIRDVVAALPEVKEAVYVSKDEVLAEFRKTHANETTILQSLDEFDGENPLRAELKIKAKNPEDFPAIVAFLKNEQLLSQQDTGTDVIDKISYQSATNKELVSRFTAFTRAVERLALYLAILAALIAILVTFNTIRLAIYTAREEIAVMRLVGASDAYIRGPFVVEGMMYGVIAGILVLALFYPITKWISPLTQNFFGSIDLFAYYISHLPLIVAAILGVGIVLGGVSSYLAVRKYLKV